MVWTNFVFGPSSNSARNKPKIASNLAYSDARHVFDEMPAWSPCTRARPTITAPLLLLHFMFGTARGAHHSLTHSPPHPPPLLLAILALTGCFWVCAPPWQASQLELLPLLAAPGQGQGRAWPRLAEARPSTGSPLPPALSSRIPKQAMSLCRRLCPLFLKKGEGRDLGLE